MFQAKHRYVLRGHVLLEHVLSAFAMILALPVMTGCSATDSVSYNSMGVKQTMTAGKDAELKNFSLPIYPNAKSTGSVAAKGDGGDHSQFLMITSTDTVDKVSDYYQSELKKQGWTVENASVMPSLQNLQAHKDNQEANVMISADGDHTSITMSVCDAIQGVPEMSTKDYKLDMLNPPTD